MSNIDKQALRKRYSAKPTPKCDICGAKMTIQRMSGSRVTYGCSGAIYDETGCHYAEGRSLADDHYEQSRVTVTDESDPDVLALLDELEAANKRIAELEAEPVSQTYNLPELIEGMEVSIDVSTCDADLGNRYFGTVTEALELDTAKNGYILLVQDAEPNFDVNGRSPVTPDGWISCSERMPDKLIPVMVMYEDGEMWSAMWNGNRWDDGTEYPDPHSVTHWREMPAAPKQEVKS